jgi:type VI protein secretion system component Hcp
MDGITSASSRPERAQSAARRRAIVVSLAAATALMAIVGPSSADVGRGFLQMRGVSGDARAEGFKSWIRVEGRYWGLNTLASGKGANAGPTAARFSTPAAPAKGAGELIVAIDKGSPALKPLMASCASQATLPELTFAESADDFRSHVVEVGERPGTIPAFFQYRLKNVQIICPVDASVPEQGFVFKFADIEWLNYQYDNPRIWTPEGRRGGRRAELLPLQPAGLPAAQSGGKVRTYAVNWFGYAHDVSNDQCPTLNIKPPQAPENDADGKPVSQLQIMNIQERRAAGGLNACQIPGIARAAQHHEPITRIARGLDLDGDGGKGSARSCKHSNYMSAQGERGIDNQFYRVAGCIPGLQGAKGLWQQVLNEEWRSGALTTLIQISGIDDERNDDNVDVTILYSEDDPAKDVNGKEILADYTFRVSQKPELTHFFARLSARIVNGVIETRPTKSLKLNLGNGPRINLADARLRLEMTPEGNLKGLLGGYQDWRYLSNYFGYTGFEVTFNFQCPAFYGALKRAADGMKDPVTGECNGISTAYEIEAVPALIPNSQLKQLFAGALPRR